MVHDVFLSFRVEDTTASFISHLYATLQYAGVTVFRDDDYLPRGDQNSTSLLRAIEESRISIIVFSRNYSDSRWCMEELTKIMECHRTKGQVFMLVFYDVDPSEVWRQAEADQFGLVEALREACDIPRLAVLNSRNESKYMRNIVETVIHLLDKIELFIADYPVGVESRVKDIIPLLACGQSNDVVVLGIYGRAGVGKTTIAKAIYNEIGHQFECRSFLAYIREVWEKDARGEVHLKEQVLFDIFKKTTKILSTESGKIIFRDRLCSKRVLLVLDDISECNQLEALCGSGDWFGSGSRIIITSRDLQILRARVDQIYTVKEMDESESIELFSWNAFKQASPREDFAVISRNVVQYSGGLPLVLEVLGTYLFDTVLTEWKRVLEKLKRIPMNQVQEKLHISYDGLHDDSEKEIFLNIASFFVGMDRNDVISILDGCGLYAEVGISVLVERGLVTVDDKNKLRMHDFLRDMGREIIHEGSRQVSQAKIYDVFLSFRGEDSRSKFISHLCTFFENAGIYVFRDDDKIQRGDMISVSLLRAIKQSIICIVVLSKHYANSKWCMLELENIMSNRRTTGLVVVLVFYEVDPSDVRHQTGEFGKAFEELITKTKEGGDERSWRTALLEVGGIAGVVIINSRNESEDIKKIVEDVTDLLRYQENIKTDLFVAEHPVGVKARVKNVIQLLENRQYKDPLLLGIWGMGGMGKTTIAKAVYNQIRRDFEANSFHLNVREVCEQNNGIVSLRQKLISDIYKTNQDKDR